MREANLAARTLLCNAVMAHCEKKNLFLSLKKYDSRRKKKLQHFFYCQRGLSTSISPIVLYYAVHSNKNISPARYSPLLLGQNAPLISHDGWLSRQCVFVWLTSIFKCYKILKEYIDYTPLEYSQCSPSVFMDAIDIWRLF